MRGLDGEDERRMILGLKREIHSPQKDLNAMGWLGKCMDIKGKVVMCVEGR